MVLSLQPEIEKGVRNEKYFQSNVSKTKSPNNQCFTD